MCLCTYYVYIYIKIHTYSIYLRVYIYIHNNYVIHKSNISILNIYMHAYIDNKYTQYQHIHYINKNVYFGCN